MLLLANKTGGTFLIFQILCNVCSMFDAMVMKHDRIVL